MLKHKYAAAVLTGISVFAAGIPVAAAEPVFSEQLNRNGIYIIAGKSPDCSFPGLPDSSLPELPEQENPELPEIPSPELPEQPDENTPQLPEENGTENTSFAMQVLHLVNQERAKEGLPALQYDAAIEKAALVRAKEAEVSFSHTRPDGSSFSTALKENGVSFRGAGENIAWGQKSPEEVMRGWMNSPGHRANIMSRSFTRIGVGHYQNSSGVNYWTQLFTN